MRATAHRKAYESTILTACHDYRNADIEPCTMGDLQGTRSALLIGDSHARHFEPFVRVLDDAAHVKVYALTNSECLALENPLPPVPDAMTATCLDAPGRDFKLIRSRRFDDVVIAERWIGKFDQPRLNALANLKRAIEGDNHD